MKQHFIHIVLSITLLFTPTIAWGQDIAEWNGQSNNGTYKLSRDIKLSSVVKIDNGKTLTLESDGNGPHTITTSAVQFFDVRVNSKLILKGYEGSEIILDGGAVFDGDHPYKEEGSDNYVFAGNTGRKMEEALYNDLGTIEIEYVTIQNVDAANNFSTSDNNGGAILIQRGGRNDGTLGSIGHTTIKNCTIKNCASRHGSAIHIANQKKQQNVTDNEAESGAVKVIDSVIEYCYASGVDTRDNATSLDQIKNANNPEGGTIRTNGTAVSNLYLEGTTVRNNYSGGYGGGLYWNGNGTSATKCVINGCTFENNVAYRKGGAMMLETTFEFSNEETTTVTGNKALGRIDGETGTGGGIVVASYDGKSMSKTNDNKYSFTYNLSKLNITENEAEEGAGISFDFEKFQLTNDNNWLAQQNEININVNFNGATISKNKATNGNGGGLRLYNNTSGKTQNTDINITFNLNSGTLSENTATGNGAGIYTYHADITTNQEGGLLTVKGNDASSGNGGGIYVEGGKTIKLGSSLMESNKAVNGAAIYIAAEEGDETDVSVTLGETTLNSNIASEKGGAIYVSGGNITLKKNNITENSAKEGGAIYVNKGSISVEEYKSTITSNSATTGSGGAFYVNEGDIKLGEAVMNENNAEEADGGAFYVNGGDITLATVTMSANNAKNGGAISLSNGSFSIGANSQITRNTASQNGGAISLSNGTFSIGEGSKIQYNTATSGNGGGLYVTNQESGTKTIYCTGGTFNNNSAMNGGGIYTDGSINLVFTANVQDNEASNGGGIYITGGTNMYFGNGLIVRNNAKQSNQAGGIGGGIYLNEGTLSFTIPENLKEGYSGDKNVFANSDNLGIYNNAADFEAADIYTSGSSTTLNLPYVKNMNLTGFDVPGSDLYWVQDFNTIVLGGKTYGRYEQELLILDPEKTIEQMILQFTPQEINNKIKKVTEEMCLDLGYDIVFVGLKMQFPEDAENEAVTIKIYYPENVEEGNNSTKTLYRTILASSTVQRVGLPTGYWFFEVPDEWNYKYYSTVVFGEDELKGRGLGGFSIIVVNDTDDDAKGLFNRKTLLSNGENVDFIFEYISKTDNNKAANVISASKHLVNKMIPVRNQQ